MINITIKNQWCYFDDTRVFDCTRFTVPSATDPLSSTTISLSNKSKQRFPTGILFIVTQRLKKKELEYNIVDENEYKYKDVMEKYSLRDYQKEAVQKVLEKKQGILKHPTGSGKTRTAICLAECIDGPILFVVDTISLINQTAKAYKELTKNIANIITSENNKISKFNIVTFQTLRSISQKRSLTKLFKKISGMIIDECHVLGAATYYKTALSIPARWRIGLSATPTDRTDSLDPLVVAATGGIIHRIPMQQLIELNNLAKPYIIFYDYSTERFKYQGYAYKEVITHNKNRNIAILKLCKIAPKPCLLFYEYKEHGHLLAKNLRNLGYNTRVVHGLHNGYQRDEAIKELVDGEIDILLTSRIFNKGVNIPELRSCVNAAGWKAFIPTIQKLGRGTRRTDDKDKIFFFDFYDVENATSLSHSRERIKNYESENLSVSKFKDVSLILDYIKNLS